jgi:hypothetical protein
MINVVNKKIFVTSDDESFIDWPVARKHEFEWQLARCLDRSPLNDEYSWTWNEIYAALLNGREDFKKVFDILDMEEPKE